MSIDSFLDAAERTIDALHGLVLVRGGAVVAEGYWHPYRADVPHRLFSLSKSFTSTAVGFAVAEGLVDLDAPVAEYFGGRGDPRMLVRHLLTMTTGHTEDTAPAIVTGEDWADAFLRLPVGREPGSYFVYNTGATYLAGAIVQRRTGQRLVDYLRPRLFDPLAFESVTWERCPLGLDTAGWGMTARTAEIARFGQLYLRDDRGILPAGWAGEATRRQVENPHWGDLSTVDWRQGYGFQFWRCRHDAFRGDGAFGQLCVVMPAQDSVLAVNSGTENMQAILDLVWEHLLDDRTPPAPATAARLATLALPALHGGQSTADGTFTVANPRRVRPEDWRPSHEQPPTIRSITFSPGLVTLEDATGTHAYPCRPGEWHTNGTQASTGAWTTPTECTLRVAYIDGPFVRTYRCAFAGDTVTITASDNVSFGPTGYAPIHAVRTPLTDGNGA
ncbi:serine hydrolase domain-containing protein [Dactylosporangium sp. CA-092794]|uniref:serine hydrolase domain-containing protein n=1 Tax=Dactylosporangium sp. CA-092794 TaxID=3239929 RepID=UPI003D8B78D1